MKISKLIKTLTDDMNKFGDLNVKISSTHCLDDNTYNIIGTDIEPFDKEYIKSVYLVWDIDNQ